MNRYYFLLTISLYSMIQTSDEKQKQLNQPSFDMVTQQRRLSEIEQALMQLVQNTNQLTEQTQQINQQVVEKIEHLEAVIKKNQCQCKKNS